MKGLTVFAYFAIILVVNSQNPNREKSDSSSEEFPDWLDLFDETKQTNYATKTCAQQSGMCMKYCFAKELRRNSSDCRNLTCCVLTRHIQGEVNPSRRPQKTPKKENK